MAHATPSSPPRRALAAPAQRPPARLRAALLLLGLLAPLGLASCAGTYSLEDRETPVHVWITAPDVAAQGGTLPALVYVAGVKAVDGPITFQPGLPTVVLPTVSVKSGPVRISAVFLDGATSVQDDVEVEGECWVQVVVRGRSAALFTSEQQPNPLAR